MRVIAAAFLLVIASAPASAWTFSMENYNGHFRGELSGVDDTGEIVLTAVCTRSPLPRTDVYLDVLAPQPGYGIPKQIVDIWPDGSRPTMVRGNAQIGSSVTVLASDGPTTVDAIGTASGYIQVNWQGTSAAFDASDAQAAVRGFKAVCASLPITGSPYP